MNKILRNVGMHLGQQFTKVGQELIRRATDLGSADQGFDVFLSDGYRSINDARLSHLSTLDLPLEGKSVLEVGAGLGFHSHFFEDRKCRIVSTDGRRENVDVMKHKFPGRNVRLFNLLDFNSYSEFEGFDIIYCYGTLYHTSKPEEILKGLSSLCHEMILLETCVSPGSHSSPQLVKESESLDQAIGIIGCRPTRPWLMEVLKKYYGYAYTSKTQPKHVDFDLDWQIPLKKQNHRAVFVGSKQPLINPMLLAELPDFQEYA